MKKKFELTKEKKSKFWKSFIESREYSKGYKEGYEDGKQQTANEIFDFMEKEYKIVLPKLKNKFKVK